MTEVDADKVWALCRQTKSAGANIKKWPPTDKNSVWYKVGVELGVITGPDPPPPPPPPPGSYGSGPYGCGWYASNLGNIEIGKGGNQTYSYGFDSLYTGDTKTVAFFLIYRDGGYAAGDGGQIRVDICADSAGRPGASLGSYLILKPKTTNWPKVPLVVALEKGKRYWVKFSNPAPNAASNYVSVDDLYAANGDAAGSPGAKLQNLVALQNNSVNAKHLPVFTVTMADGQTQGGVGYIDCPSRYDASDHAEIVFTPKQARTVTAVYARLSSGNGTVRAVLAGATGQASAVAGAWNRIPLSASLSAGQPQKLTLDGDFTIEALEKGAKYGLHDDFPDGHAVIAGRTDIDLSVYLT